MALPAHLQPFDRLLDLIAEQMAADELAGVPLEAIPDPSEEPECTTKQPSANCSTGSRTR